MKNRVLWIGLLVGALGLFSPQRGAAQADDQPAPPASESLTNQSVTNAPNAEEAMDTADEENAKRRTGRRRDAVVSFGSTAELKKGESAEAVVAILGSAIARGEVHAAVVAIAGDVTVSGEVGEAAVAVLGNVTIEEGSIVTGDVVAVGGTITIATGAKVEGEVVAVGGTVDIAEGATIEGGIQEVPVPGLHLLKDWLVHCVFKLRPLAPQVGWVWLVAGAFFLIYFLVAVALPRPVEVCVGELTRRPATTFLMALLTLVLLPVILLILAATVIGGIVIPFLLAALMFGAIIGKVAFLEYLGQSVGRAFGTTALFKPVAAFLIGSILITLLYLVPVLGLVTLGVTAVWGLGAVVMAVFTGVRRERPVRSNTQPPATGSGAAMNLAASSSLVAEGNPGSLATPLAGPGEGAPAAFPSAATPGAPAVGSEALTYPRASFWERMGAAFLDIVLISIVSAWTGPFWLVVALAYFSGMWAWRGTTVGGIVLNLKVVRLDDRPITFPVALVRALGAAFSVVVLFLGFLCISWDLEKQGWHDKIAGTVVVRQPRGIPLICL